MKNHKAIYKSLKVVPFKKKKFMLVINRSKLNSEIDSYTEEIKMNFPNEIIDTIDIHTKKIKNASCYHSKELLDVFVEYKFILCLENSYNNGYITEKIFNCFFSKTIPLYKGAYDVYKFINRSRFINLRKDKWMSELRSLNNEQNISTMANRKIPAKNYNDEDFMNVMKNHIESIVRIA